MEHHFHLLQGQIIPVPDTQPPIFLGHYAYPISTVTLKFVYATPTQCPVAESSRLPNITIDVPRGGSVLNVLELAANMEYTRFFQAFYLPDHGYLLSWINQVPPAGAHPFCMWSWSSDPLIHPSVTSEFPMSEVFIPAFRITNPVLTFTYQFASSKPPPSDFKLPFAAPNNVVVSSSY